MTWTWAWVPVLFIRLNFLVIASDACASLLGCLVPHFLHSLSGNEGHWWFVKFDIAIIAARSHSFLRATWGWNADALGLWDLPVNCGLRRFPDLPFCDSIWAGPDLARIIYKPAHFAYISRCIVIVLSSPINDGCQEPRGDRGHRHLLKTWVWCGRRGTTWSDRVDYGDGINDAHVTTAWASTHWSLELWYSSIVSTWPWGFLFWLFKRSYGDELFWHRHRLGTLRNVPVIVDDVGVFNRKTLERCIFSYIVWSRTLMEQKQSQ